MSTIALTLPVTSVTLTEGRATITASVTNSATVPARIVLGAFGPVGAGAAAPTGGAPATGAPAAPANPLAWTTIDRSLREVAAGATEQFTVNFAPPAGTAAGSYPVRFIAYSADEAPEEHADQARQVDIVVPAAATPPPAARPWWPWLVAAVLVVIAGVVAWFVLRPDDPPPITPPTPTPTASSPSPTPMVDLLPLLTAHPWRAVVVNDGSGSVVAVLASTQLTATFTNDLKVAGSGGCNGYNSAFSVEGEAIKVQPPMMTMIACSAAIAQQESRFMAALTSATTFSIEAGELRLRNADGTTAVAFAKLVAEPTFTPIFTKFPGPIRTFIVDKIKPIEVPEGP